MARTASLSKLKRAIGRIQRLCVASAGRHMVPTLIEEFRAAIPFETCGLLLAGPKQELVGAYTDAQGSPTVGSYIDRFQDLPSRSDAVFRPFTERMRTKHASPAGDFLKRVLTVEPQIYARSDLYNEVFRPIGADKGVTVRITEHDGVPRAALTLFRKEKDPAFTAFDVRLLNATAAFVAHAMRDTPQQGGYVAGDDYAFLVADRHGIVRHMSPLAHRLLVMAWCPGWTSRVGTTLRPETLPGIKRLCERLVAAEEGNLPSAAPYARERNDWGEFVVRAQWLDSTGTETSRDLIGITIERREPRSVDLVRKIEALPLSQREKSICFLLASNRTRSEIADFVGVSEHTVAAQQRSVYAKTGIRSRVELLDLLSGL